MGALSIYLIVLVLIVLTGVFLARNIPGGQYGMILEMAPLRMPDPVLVMKKSWGRIQEFLFIAMPLLLAGSVVLGALDYYGVVDAFSLIVAPVYRGVPRTPCLCQGSPPLRDPISRMTLEPWVVQCALVIYG